MNAFIHFIQEYIIAQDIKLAGIFQLPGSIAFNICPDFSFGPVYRLIKSISVGLFTLILYTGRKGDRQYTQKDCDDQEVFIFLHTAVF